MPIGDVAYEKANIAPESSAGVMFELSAGFWAGFAFEEVGPGFFIFDVAILAGLECEPSPIPTATPIPHATIPSAIDPSQINATTPKNFLSAVSMAHLLRSLVPTRRRCSIRKL